uniref:BV8 family protein n=2 Tax=root TaxID=1 RepID=A0A1D5APK9_9VIRU|nr:hypothetical protein A6F54_89 [Microplitis mediator bracovirus]
MEEEYATIVYVELAENIYVPYEWPIRGIENLILVLAEKIISQFGFASPVLQVKNIPTRLMRRTKTTGSIHVFEKVAKEEMVGSFVYDIVLPKEEDSIHMEMTRGSSIKKGSWPNYVTSFCPRDNKISYHLIPQRFR